MNNKWQIYDELIEGIPSDLYVKDCTCGTNWTYVETQSTCGVALTVRQRAGFSLLKGQLPGMALKDAAALSKSWNFIEASIGMAAINSWYNRLDHIKEMGVLPDGENRKSNTVFSVLADEMKGKNVTVVGHFPHIEKTIAPICNLTILERDPSAGDMPDSACEYIMQDQDYLIITGMTFTNKTLPRLLELARPDTVISLAGPSVPMCEGLKKYGVNHLSGYCVSDTPALKESIKYGVHRDIFKYGYMIDY